MSKAVVRRVLSLRIFPLLVACSILASCGGVEWFPEYKRAATTPDQFSFTTKTGVKINETVTSDPITVSGLTGSSSPISVTGPVGSNSKYSINGGAPTDAAGTVSNGDKVTVSHTSASTAGGSVVSTLTIGNINGTFTSVTATVAAPTWQNPTPMANGVFQVVSNPISSVDTIAHTISIKDSLNSTTPLFGIFDSAGVVSVNFTHGPATVFLLNNQLIYVRNIIASGSTPVTTTLTIDGADYAVPLSQ